MVELQSIFSFCAQYNLLMFLHIFGVLLGMLDVALWHSILVSPFFSLYHQVDLKRLGASIMMVKMAKCEKSFQSFTHTVKVLNSIVFFIFAFQFLLCCISLSVSLFVCVCVSVIAYGQQMNDIITSIQQSFTIPIFRANFLLLYRKAYISKL